MPDIKINYPASGCVYFHDLFYNNIRVVNGVERSRVVYWKEKL
jgi:hypothetical protein